MNYGDSGKVICFYLQVLLPEVASPLQVASLPLVAQ
jgi:hypothetical protein